MDDLVIDDAHTLPGWELWWTTSRAGGPGGQHVNKTSSRVTLYWRPAATQIFSPLLRARLLRRLAPRLDGEGVLQINCETTRSQHQNRQLARERLAELIRAAIRPPPKPRVATRPTRGSVERRLQAKQQRAEIKRLRGRPSDDH